MSLRLLNLVVIVFGIAVFAVGVAASIKPVTFLGFRTKKAGLIVMALGAVISMLAGTAEYLMKCC